MPYASKVAARWVRLATERRTGGMVSPLDLQRLAVRIERLMHTRTHGWHPGDELEFKNALPNSRIQDERRKLPDPTRLREITQVTPMSDEDQKWVQQNWRLWLPLTLRLEGLIHDNDPRNPKRMMRDMARGRFPFR